MARIVVGVDGSPASNRVLGYAIDEALTHQLPLVVIAVHVVPAAAPEWGMPHMVPARQDLERTRSAAQQLVDSVVKEYDAAGKVDLSLHVHPGVPAEVLVAETRPEDDLIVGSRGVGGWRRALLGSVSRDVVRHAQCTVTIVRTNIDAKR